MIRFKTAAYGHAGDGRLDVTRSGADRALRAGQPALGAPFAPSASLLWPAKQHLDLLALLDRRVSVMHVGEHSAHLALKANQFAELCADAYRRLYLAEMRVSAGMGPRHPKWTEQEAAAIRRGVRPAPEQWKALLDGSLAGPEPVLVCFCPHREVGAEQRHTCHRHLLAEVLRAYGAEDLGEIDLPKADGSKLRARKPMPPLGSMVAISGTRPPQRGDHDEWTAYKAICDDVRDVVRSLPTDTTLIAVKAAGVDMVAADAAREVGLDVIEIPPWWDAWGDRAPLVRNIYCASAPRLFAWPSKASKGTRHAIALARDAGVEVDERRLW